MTALQAIEEISEQASREWSVEKALDKMHADWQDLTFELAEWKSTGTHILRGKSSTCTHPHTQPHPPAVAALQHLWGSLRDLSICVR